MKYLILTLAIIWGVVCTANADDQVRRMEIHGLIAAQAQTGMEWINGLDSSGISVMSMEYTPNAGNPEIDQNVLRINVAGPDIAAFVVRVRNKVLNSLGRPLDLDENRTGDLAAIRQAWLTYGPAIENRADLKTALYAIWRNGARCMSGEDSRTLRTWMADRGFNSIQALKVWLNETP